MEIAYDGDKLSLSGAERRETSDVSVANVTSPLIVSVT
jgi:hypothetical protein